MVVVYWILAWLAFAFLGALFFGCVLRSPSPPPLDMELEKEDEREHKS